MLLLLNEWVFEDLLGENGVDVFTETGMFLNAFYHSDDRLVIPSEKRWNDKAFRLMNMTAPQQRLLSKLFHSLKRDSTRAVHVKAEELPSISRELQENTPPEDLYLVLAYISSAADLIVTTDEKLHAALSLHDGINSQLRGDFLASYPQGDLP